jgi:RimJ/RimL family protein N-acetyltransferase
MTRTTPLADTMHAFERSLLTREAPPRHGDVDPTLRIRDGDGEIAFARMQGDHVTAFVHFIEGPVVDGVPSVNLGCCVPEAFQSQGRASEAIEAAYAELAHRYARDGVARFVVETFVLVDNLPSRRLAERVVSPSPVAAADPFSGLPALHYVREIATAAK